jgi:DNA polymerase
MNYSDLNPSSMRSAYLKEMGITEWTDRSSAPMPLHLVAVTQDNPPASAQPTAKVPEGVAEMSGCWIFMGAKPQGDALSLFQNIVRVLGLPKGAWVWQDQKAGLDTLLGSTKVPVVVIAFGAATAQRLSGENAPLAEMRGAIHSLMQGEEEVPLIATVELAQVLARPHEKALLWEDLLLARSVLQSL